MDQPFTDCWTSAFLSIKNPIPLCAHDHPGTSVQLEINTDYLEMAAAVITYLGGHDNGALSSFPEVLKESSCGFH